MQRFTLLRQMAGSALLLALILSCAAAEKRPADETEVAPAGSTTAASPDTARGAVDPRAYRDSTLSYEEQARRDQEWRREVRFGWVDTLDLNARAVIALHAAPRSERRTFAEVAELARECDNLVTAVPPGEWDIFVILAGFNQLQGVSLSFAAPPDWSFETFSLNPELRGPYSWGNIRESEMPPYMVAFACVAHPEEEKEHLPEGGVEPALDDLIVLGRLELIAPSSGSLTIADHPKPPAPEVMNCWLRTLGVRTSLRGRIDVGQGPGVRPCESGNPIALNLVQSGEEDR